ncbi:MAG: hypothetical protein RLY30_1398 [Pseudomonadota bacterium]|jgi:hypothetical protein
MLSRLSGRIGFILSLIAVSICVVYALSEGQYEYQEKGSWGLSVERESVLGRAVVREVKSGTPAERAGLQVGDRLDIPTTYTSLYRALKPGAELAVGYERNGVAYATTLTLDVAEIPLNERIRGIYYLAMVFMTLIAGAIFGLAGARSAHKDWFALVLLSLCLVFLRPDGAQSQAAYALINTAGNLGLDMAALAMVQFWRVLDREHQIGLSPHWGKWFTLLVVLAASHFLLVAFHNLLSYLAHDASSDAYIQGLLAWHPSVNLIGTAWVAFTLLGYGTSLVIPALVLGKGRGKALNGAQWAAATLLLTFAYVVGAMLIPLFTYALGLSEEAYEAVSEVWFYVAAPLLPISIVLYSIVTFARRVISFEFVLNLTLIYSVTVAALLGLFWVLKTQIQSLNYLPDGTQDIALSGGVALLAALAKRFKTVAERGLRRLLFRGHTLRSDNLMEFLGRLPYFKTKQALDDGVIAAISAYCYGFKAHFFELQGRHYLNRDTNIRFGIDSDLVLRLRAGRSPISCEGEPVLPDLEVRLAAPLFHRSELAAFILVADGPDLPVLRTDEFQQLATVMSRWATERDLIELEVLRSASTYRSLRDPVLRGWGD